MPAALGWQRQRVQLVPKPLAEIALDAKLVSRRQVDAAARHADRHGHPMVVSLVREHGVDELALVGAIRRQMRVPLVDPGEVSLDSDALRMLPRAAAERLRILPLAIEVATGSRTLDVAAADPTDAVGLAEVEHVTGCRVRVSLMPLSAIEEMIEEGYRQFVTEVIPRRRAFGEGVSVTTAPIGPPAGARDPATVPHHRVSEEADLALRHRALLSLLVEKELVTEEEYEARVREAMKRRDGEG